MGQVYQIIVLTTYTGTFLWRKKLFNYSELHFSEVTYYKIHTLGTYRGIKEGPKILTSRVEHNY